LTRGEGIYGTIGYIYDDVGNRETKTVGEETETYTYKEGTNHLKSITGATVTSFDYDPNGNTEQMGALTFDYTEDNRLTEARVNEEGVGRYTYNGLGQRIIKKTSDPTIIYHYDLQGHLIAETKKNGKVITEYVWLDDRLLAIAPKGKSRLLFVHSDHLGTPIRMTNKKGALVWRTDHKPFGEASVNEDPDGDGKQVTLNLRFPGQYFDKETGLHYNYFRDYHPGIGRYLTVDRLRFLRIYYNVYSYGGNNPVSFFDFFGLFHCRVVPSGPILRTSTGREMTEWEDVCDWKEVWSRNLSGKALTAILIGAGTEVFLPGGDPIAGLDIVKRVTKYEGTKRGARYTEVKTHRNALQICWDHCDNVVSINWHPDIELGFDWILIENLSRKVTKIEVGPMKIKFSFIKWLIDDYFSH
jgi:RHS repeat-associated protein